MVQQRIGARTVEVAISFEKQPNSALSTDICRRLRDQIEQGETVPLCSRGQLAAMAGEQPGIGRPSRHIDDREHRPWMLRYPSLEFLARDVRSGEHCHCAVFVAWSCYFEIGQGRDAERREILGALAVSSKVK